MKKSIILALSLVLSVATFAQQLATLNHNGTTTAYYGMNALQQAHSAAVNGDIITLSTGIFNSVDITKAVTIRGAGAWVDTNGNSNTVLYGDFTLNIQEDTNYNLVMEGINTMGEITYNEVHNPQFVKCEFGQFTYYSYSNIQMYNASFNNCILGDWRNYKGTSSNVWPAIGTQFTNCIVLNQFENGCSGTYDHCIVNQDPSTASSKLFQNSVLYFNWLSSYPPTYSISGAFNCMYINIGNYGSIFLFKNMANRVQWNRNIISSVFKNFDGTYSSTTTFELQDSIAANYLGTDGTQIGIYGGLHPFSPKVTSPVIKSINVAQRNNSEGKLEVNIEMVTEDE